MTPEDRTKLDNIEKLLMSVIRGENIDYIENIKRRLDIPNEVSQAISNTPIGALSNVDDSGISDGQLLKYNSSSGLYEAANDIDT